MIVLACLALNIAFFFYLHAWKPVVDFVRAARQMRMIRAFRIVGLLLLLLAVNVMPVHAQKIIDDRTGKPINSAQMKKYLELDRARAAEMSELFRQQTTAQYYSDGDYYLLKHQQPEETTGWTALDNAIRYVWNNAGKLTAVFALLAFIYLMIGKLEASNETYGDVMRREAAERWEEEYGDDIHNPFNSPEGMQPASQYVSVRTRR